MEKRKEEKRENGLGQEEQEDKRMAVASEKSPIPFSTSLESCGESNAEKGMCRREFPLWGCFSFFFLLFFPFSVLFPLSLPSVLLNLLLSFISDFMSPVDYNLLDSHGNLLHSHVNSLETAPLLLSLANGQTPGHYVLLLPLGLRLQHPRSSRYIDCTP